jgi:hypothetical protein
MKDDESATKEYNPYHHYHPPVYFEDRWQNYSIWVYGDCSASWVVNDHDPQGTMRMQILRMYNDVHK